jgi:hypothetical protein
MSEHKAGKKDDTPTDTPPKRKNYDPCRSCANRNSCDYNHSPEYMASVDVCAGWISSDDENDNEWYTISSLALP